MAFIELASPWMLAWLTAAGIPLALHLLHRRKQQVLPWAAMELLMQIISQHSRRMRIEQWLLLALRTLALVLFACALARPWLNDSLGGISAEASAAPPQLWILVLDSSYSMMYEEGDASRWELAKQRASEIVQSLRLGDAVSLIRLASPSGAVVLEPSFEQQRVASELQRLECSAGGADLTSCLDLIERVLQSAQQSERLPRNIHVRIFSDLGSDTWQTSSADVSRRRLAVIAGKVTSLEIDSPAGDAIANVAISDLRASQAFALPGRPLTITATVRNYSQAAIDRLPVQFQTDRRTVRTEFVDCPGGEARTVVLDLEPPRSAFWSISAEIPHDRLAIDDRRDLVVPVRQQVRVACVEDQVGAARMAGLSLSPLSLGAAREGIFLVETIPLFELNPERLKQLDAVLLCNVSELSETQATMLRTFVQTGGAVLCMLGPEANASNWNTRDRGVASIAGFELLEPSPEGDYVVDPLAYESPIARPFADYPDAGLLTTPIFRYWRIKPTTAEPVTIDLNLSNGEPWIVRRSFGEGWIACMLSAPSVLAERGASQWNAIGAWPSFVPLMQQLVQTIVGGSQAEHNFIVGQTLSGRVDSVADKVDVQIIDPQGVQSTIEASREAQQQLRTWSYTASERAGLYQIKVGNVATTPYAVNVDPSQSSLVSVPLASIPKVSGSTEVRSTTGVSNALEAESQSGINLNRDGLPQKILLALFAVLVSESILAWSMGRRFA